MACKVLDTLSDDDSQPLPWMSRTTTPGATANRALAPAAGRPAPPPGTRAGEVAALHQQLEELKVAAEQQVRAAFEQGFHQGENNARQKLETDYRSAVERLGNATAEVAGSRAETLRRAESDTVRLAIEIARRVLHREVSVDAYALEGLVKAALDKLRDQEIIRVRAHADLVKTLTECIARTGRGQSVEILPDPSRAPGGVVFEISRGCLDASLDTQLREIERGLVDQLKTRS
jgi:flagellar assembly protein FliH